jgi:hypothetical protein
MASPVAQQGGDTLFAIDRHVEPAIEAAAIQWTQDWPDTAIMLIAEGLGDTGEQRYGPADARQGCRVIIDPIDGTRNIMYDKRAAWFLAAAVPDRGEETRLSEAIASVIVELPTSKQAAADAFVATNTQPTRGRRMRLSDSVAQPLPIHPSSAPTLREGFGQVSNFFPGAKLLAGELMERIVQATLGDVQAGSAVVYEDQYISTGGQMVELMMGRDRFCCDLRPLFYRILEQQSGHVVHGLECHPYDMAGCLAAQQAGVLLTDGLGRQLDLPLNVHTGVHWCGYANRALQQAIEPVIIHWLAQKGIRC